MSSFRTVGRTVENNFSKIIDQTLKHVNLLYGKSSSSGTKDVLSICLGPKPKDVLAFEIGERTFQTLNRVDFPGAQAFTRLAGRDEGEHENKL